MGRTLALVVLASVSVAIAKADDKPTPPSTVTPDKDVRLFCLTSARPQKIGVLTYYPNAGGGYTFVEGKQIAFYALPYLPTTYQTDGAEVFQVNANGKVVFRRRPKRFILFTIGPSQLPFGGQAIYRGEMIEIDKGVFRRNDMQIAKWSRDTPDGHFTLSTMVADRETRLKLKSIVPMLEHAEHVR